MDQKRPLSGKSIVALSTVYTISLVIVSWYIQYTSIDIFKYYSFSAPSFPIMIISVVIAVLPSILINRRPRHGSYALLLYLYLIGYIPSQTMPYYTSDLSVYRLLLLSIVMLLSFLWLCRPRGTIFIFRPRPALWESARDILVIGVSLLLVLPAILLLDLPGFVPSYESVYSVRYAFISQKSMYGPVLERVISYSVEWLLLVMVPVLGVASLSRYRSHPSITTVGIFISISFGILIFVLTGKKSALAIPILTIGIYSFVSYRPKLLLPTAVLGGISLFLSFPLFAQLIGGTPLAVVRRIFVTPGVFTGYYYEFFVTQPPTWYSQLSYIPVRYPFEQQLSQVIAGEYLNNPESYANANFWATGYASIGVSGMIVSTVVFDIFLVLYDSFTAKMPVQQSTAILSGMMMSVTVVPISAMLFYHGILFLLGFLYIYNSQSYQEGTITDISEPQRE